MGCLFYLTGYYADCEIKYSMRCKAKTEQKYRVGDRRERSKLEETAVVEGGRPPRSAADQVLECGLAVRIVVESHLLLHLAEHSLRLLAKALVVAEYRQTTHRDEPVCRAACVPLYTNRRIRTV